jgi:hypothetical protein
MTTEAEETTTKPLQKGWMSPARKRQLITEIAIGEIPMRQLAHKYSVTYQYVRQLKVEYSDEISEITAEITDKEREILWPTSRFARNYERVTDLVAINEEMERLRAAAKAFADSMGTDGEPTSEHWLRLAAAKQNILKAIAEDYGQLPTRAPAPPPEQGKATYEIPGVDLGEVTRAWEQPAEVPK